MRYRDFTSEDFAEDSFFIRWVKTPDAESDWFWQTFMRDHPHMVPVVEEARKIVSLFDFETDTLSGEELSDMRDRLLMAIHAEKQQDHSINRLTVAKRWLKYAAVVIPLLGLGFYTFLRSDVLGPEEQGQSRTELRANPKGQKSVLWLGDGTKVWLNADSRLQYAKDFFTGETRNVYLEGEAFFEVARDVSRPFIVHTSALDIRVLGTAFNVKAYGEENTIETTLVHGKVSIEPLTDGGGGQENVILKPNQKAVFSKAKNTIDVKAVTTATSGAWRQDRLVLDEVPFDHVIVELERWYNIRVHVDDREKLDCKLTADIRNESVEEFLKLLQETHNIEYVIDGADVFIKGSLCAN